MLNRNRKLLVRETGSGALAFVDLAGPEPLTFKGRIMSVVFIATLLLLAYFVGRYFSQNSSLIGYFSINGNDSFTPANGVNGGGNGTIDNPYVIENWIINASSTNGIVISHTTAYFIIRNCLIENGGDAFRGIYLVDVINGKLENNTLKGNRNGIRLEYSSHNNLTNNICEKNYFGLYLWASSYNNIVNNTCESGDHGFCIASSSSYNILANNICSNHNTYGIALDALSNHNIVDNNICSNNVDDGIILVSSTYNNITNNICSHDYYGIFTHSSSDLRFETPAANYNILNNNTCSYNFIGIYLGTSSNNDTIFFNYLLNNTTNAYDNNTTNNWNNGSGGNYWSNWQPPTYPDENHDGIVDAPFSILGGSSIDHYPLVIGWVNATRAGETQYLVEKTSICLITSRVETSPLPGLPIFFVSYALLAKDRHAFSILVAWLGQ